MLLAILLPFYYLHTRPVCLTKLDIGVQIVMLRSIIHSKDTNLPFRDLTILHDLICKTTYLSNIWTYAEGDHTGLVSVILIGQIFWGVNKCRRQKGWQLDVEGRAPTYYLAKIC